MFSDVLHILRWLRLEFYGNNRSRMIRRRRRLSGINQNVTGNTIKHSWLAETWSITVKFQTPTRKHCHRCVSACAGHDARFFNAFLLCGQFNPVLAKRPKNFPLEDSLSLGVDRMKRNFEPMRRLVESWPAPTAVHWGGRLTIYRAFVEGSGGSALPLKGRI
jgi:hypothetical protein